MNKKGYADSCIPFSIIYITFVYSARKLGRSSFTKFMM